MTPEEKAKAYDEVLNKAKELMSTSVAFDRFTIERIFPELKEDDDEKIRKVLIDYFKRYKEQEECGIKTFYGIPTDDILAWLEKQGDKDELIKELGEYKAKYTQEVLEKHLRVMNKDDERLRKTTISFLKDFADKGYENAVECIDWLEKHDEQKPQGKTALEAINEGKVDNVNKVEPKDYSSIDPHFGKPIDKVEPKFHEGEWLCENEPNNYARFIQILEIVNVQGKERYRISKDIHNDEDIVEFYFVEKYYHKFGIKDAKDGDILASKSGNKIFSYRGSLDLRGNPCAYYGIYKVHDGIYFSPCAIGNSFTHEEVFPATKEQRKILFEELTAAKSVLHFNKKELKKIEDLTEIPFGAKDSELQEATYYIPKGFHAEIDKDKAVTEIKKLSAYLDSLHEQRLIEKILSIIDALEVKEL